MTDGDRTTAQGLFLYAHSYHVSAMALEASKVRASHSRSPIDFLYYQSIELYLKAYLRAHETSVDELRKKYGHSLKKASRAAAKLGLHFDDDDFAIFSLIDCNKGQITARFIQTGFYKLPEHKTLNCINRYLFNAVGDELIKGGVTKHLPVLADKTP